MEMKRALGRAFRNLIESRGEIIFKLPLNILREMHLKLTMFAGEEVREGIVKLHIFRDGVENYVMVAEVLGEDEKTYEIDYGVVDKMILRDVIQKALENELDVVRYSNGNPAGIEED